MPSASDFDPDRYREQVLEPARKLGGVLPADLMLRYAVPDETARNALAFEAHVARVRKHWRSLRQKRVYAQIAVGLLAADADLAASGKLTYAHFAQRRADEKAAAMRSLERTAAAVAATTTVVDRARVSSLAALLRGSLDDRTVEEVLRKHQVMVVDERWALPEQPSGAARSTLATNLAVLGLSLAAEAALGTGPVRAGFRLREGFRLTSGARLTRDQLTELRQQQSRKSLDERKTALDNVLATLGAVVERPAALDALILWQLVDVLAPQITAGLPARAVADAAADLGLDRVEAAELAYALVEQRSFQDPTRASVQDALNAGELFVARRRAIALPDDDVLRQRIGIEVSRVESLVKEADEARNLGLTEAEAELLSRALAIAGSAAVDLRSRLQALPPPAPTDARVTVSAGQVLLTWAPAPARTGGLLYRVLRGDGSPPPVPGGHLVAQTGDLQAVDAEPPPGESLYYSVIASRGGDVWSSQARARTGPESGVPTGVGEPVVVLPEVQHAELDLRDGVVVGSWRAPPAAADVVVHRRSGTAPDPLVPEQRILSTLAGFRDPGAVAGVRHHYRISALYIARDGRRWISDGVVHPVTPEAPMDAVEHLEAEDVPGTEPRLRLTWVVPDRGAVTIYRHHTPPPWPPGTAVRIDELSRHGRPLGGTVEAGPGRQRRISTPYRDGRSYFTAITVGVDMALVGATVSVASVAPVSRLRAHRQDTRVRLQWDWPEAVQNCRVQWFATSDPDQAEDAAGPGRGDVLAADCGRRRYHDDGGFEISVDHRPTVVRVRATRRDGEGETTSVPVEVTVPGQDIVVRYAFRRPARLSPWRGVRLVLSADRPCRVPPLVVVHSPGRVMPLRAGAGTTILRLPALDLDPASPWSAPVPEPAGSDDAWLSCFFADDLTPTGIALVRAGGRR